MLRSRPLVFENKDYRSYVENVYISSLCNVDKKPAKQALLKLHGNEKETEKVFEEGRRVPIQERILAAKGLINQRPSSAPETRSKSSRRNSRMQPGRMQPGRMQPGRMQPGVAGQRDGGAAERTTRRNQSSDYRFRKGRPGSCCTK